MTTVGMLVFPGFELLDLAAPLDFFARAPDMRALTVAQTRDLVEPDLAPAVRPDVAFADAPDLDILFVPGGHGIGGALESDATLDFVSERGARAAYVTSVCTGALLLGAAGLLRGYRATTHWRYLDLLPIFGAEPATDRVVIDRNRVTAGGVTSGMDFGLRLVAELRGDDVARRLQLGLEYDPAPPFRSGHPSVAEPALVDAYRRSTQQRYADRERIAKAAVAKRLRS